MKNIKGLLIYTLLASLLFSCNFNTPIEPRDQGTISIGCRGITRAGSNIESEGDLTFNLTFANIKSGYLFEGTFNNGNTIEIPNVKAGDYFLRVHATDGFNEYVASADVNVNFTNLKQDEVFGVFVVVEQKTVAGQIKLDFNTLSFTDSSLISVKVFDKDNKELYSTNDLSPLTFINNTYTIPSYFKDGQYTIKVEGGNIGEELYIVNEGKPVAIEIGNVITTNVNSKAYCTYYVNQSSNDAEEKGTSKQPFKDIFKAVNEISNEATKIVIEGTYNLNTPLGIKEGANVVIEGINNASLVLDPSSSLKSSGNLILKNINISNTLELINGSAVLKGNIGLEKINVSKAFIDKNPITIDGNINPLSTNIELNLESSALLEGNKIFSLSLSSNLDYKKIKIFNSSFVINNIGEVSKPLFSYTFTPPVSYTNITYSIYVNGKLSQESELKQLSNIYLDLKEGDTYSFTLNGFKNDIYYMWKNEGTCTSAGPFTFTCDETNKEIVSGTIKVNSTSVTSTDYPLYLTLTDSNGKEIVSKITSLPFTKNILPDSYSVSISGKANEKSYVYDSVESKITVTKNTESPLNIKVVPSFVIYVDSSSSSGNGTKEKPFASLTDAFNSIKNENIPYTILLKSDVTVTSTLQSITKAFNIKIIGVGPTTPIVTCNDGFITLNNDNATLTLQNIKINSSSITTNNSSLICVEKGKLFLKNKSVLSSPLDMNAVLVQPNSYLYLEDDATIEQGLIKTTSTSNIFLRSALTSTSPFTIAMDSYSNSNGLIKETAPGYIDSSNHKLKVQDGSYYISDSGSLIQGLYIFELDDFIKNNEPELDLTVTINNDSDIKAIIPQLNRIPTNSNKRVNLTIQLKKVTNTNNYIDKNNFNLYTRGCDFIKSITLGEGFSQLRQYAINNFKNLETLNLPQSLVSIGSYNFRECPKLKTLILPPNLNNINAIPSDSSMNFMYNDGKDRKFYCRNVKKEYLIKSGTNILPYVTTNNNLERIYSLSELSTLISALNATCPNDARTDVNIDMSTLPPDRTFSSYLTDLTSTLGITVRKISHIPDGLFKDCGKKVYCIRLPEEVTSIGDGILENCSAYFGLIPDTQFDSLDVTVLISKYRDELYHVIDNTKNLTEIDLSTYPVRVLHPKLLATDLITSLKVPQTYTWYKMGTNEKVDISDPAQFATDLKGKYKNVGFVSPIPPTELGNELSLYMRDMLNTHLTVTNEDINTIDFPSLDHGKMKVILNLWYSPKLTTIPVGFANNKKYLTKVVLPPSLTTISDDAFAYCDFSEITIPSNVTKIGKNTILTLHARNLKVKFEGGGQWTNSSGDILDMSTATNEVILQFFSKKDVTFNRMA